jgi:hypothetical protein
LLHLYKEALQNRSIFYRGSASTIVTSETVFIENKVTVELKQNNTTT